jgi:N-glycosylase/DNA lyase
MYSPAPSGLAALQFLWNHYQDRFQFAPQDSLFFEDEFFFCLLGGYSISYELNKSAFSILKLKRFFAVELPWEDEGRISKQISAELQKPQFLPKKSNGDYRSYRFPNRKASIIASAGHWLKHTCEFNLRDLLENSTNPTDKRKLLLECPGFGLKSASWLLRNIGMGDNLAIIDIHILKALQEFKIIPDQFNVDSDYLEIEKIYCSVCDQIGAKPQILDLIIWSWDRGDYNYGKTNII